MAHSTVATPQFTLAYDSFEPAEEGLREALTSTGNGYFCTRRLQILTDTLQAARILGRA